MSQRACLACVSALLLVSAIPGESLRAAAGSYTVEDIGPAELQTVGLSVNDAGVVTGYGTDSSFARLGFRDDGVPVVLAGPSGPVAEATSLNDTGVIAGYMRASSGQPRAVRYDPASDTLVELDTALGFGWGTNATGIVVGGADVFGTSAPQAVRWNLDGSRTALGSLGGPTSQARAVNDAGVIVGEATTATNYGRAFRYSDDTGMTALASLGGYYDSARAINAVGEVAGYASALDSALWRAVRWRPSGTVEDLGTLGGMFSAAYGINDAGDIVGWSTDAVGRNRAFLVSDGAMVDLNTLLPEGTGWVLTHAYDINNVGQVVGAGVVDGRMRAFLLSPSVAPSVDTTPPTITSVLVSPEHLWPPNHQLVSVTVAVAASDDSGDPVACAISHVESSDPDNGGGDGDTPHDIQLAGPLAVDLRAERSGFEATRVYTVTVECRDTAGNLATGLAPVWVTK